MYMCDSMYIDNSPEMKVILYMRAEEWDQVMLKSSWVEEKHVFQNREKLNIQINTLFIGNRLWQAAPRSWPDGNLPINSSSSGDITRKATSKTSDKHTQVHVVLKSGTTVPTSVRFAGAIKEWCC